MPGFEGRFHYLDEQGAAVQAGPCRLEIGDDACSVLPARGALLSFDLGDAEAVSAGEWDMRLWFFDHHSLLLTHFAKAFGEMRDALLAAWRDRTVRCLLLEDLEELKRFDCHAAIAPAESTRAEVRVFKSNIAIIPESGEPVQWRLADVDALEFEPDEYRVTLASGTQRLRLSRLGKKTDECRGVIESARGKLAERTAAAFRKQFSFLDTGQLRRLASLMPEGRSVALTRLAEIHPNLPAAILERAVDEPLRPYFDALKERAVEGSLMAGFKFASGEGDEEENTEEPFAPTGLEADDGLLFWFFFPLAAPGGGFSGKAAWEASTGGGRATYIFSLGSAQSTGAVETAVQELTRALALVNFRREPIYLPDESLAAQPRYRRYEIGCRRLPELRRLRAAYLGRALHSELESWQGQLEAAFKAERG